GPHGSDAAIDLTGLQLDWFRHHLGGGSPLSTERVRAFLCGSNRWLSLSSWPPTESSHLALAVVERADSRELGPAPEPPRTGPVVEVPLDVRDPFPTRGGPTFLPGMEVAANAGPRAQGSLLERADVVVAQSAVLPQELCVMGDVILHARAIVEATAGQQSPALLCARLCDRMPDGTTLVVTEGAASVPAESGEHHVDLCLGPVGWSFAPQHRLVLTLSRASVPRFRPPAHDEPERIVIDTGGATVLRLPLVASSTTSGGEGGP
ncbi:MAG TPA: CocE/NonD family hydrolase, partial [Acidimicrobiales bacterium]